MSDLPHIPFCESEFLQEFIIEFGVYMAARKPCWRNFYQASRDICEHEGELLERLSVWISTFDFTRTNLNLWEDNTIWISIDLLAPDHHTSEYGMGFYPNFENLDFADLLEALDATVALSTRLCYGESPAKILKKIWRHAGRVKTVGSLSKKS